MKLLIKIVLILVIIAGVTKFTPANKVYWGYTHQTQAKQTISEFYRLYNYNNFHNIYDNLLDSQTRLKITENQFSAIMQRFKKQKGNFISPCSKAYFHYAPFVSVKNFILDFFIYRDNNIEQNTFYVLKKNGRTYYCVNFHAKFQRGFSPANFVLTDTIDGIKVLTPMKLSLLKEYI